MCEDLFSAAKKANDEKKVTAKDKEINNSSEKKQFSFEKKLSKNNQTQPVDANTYFEKRLDKKLEKRLDKQIKSSEKSSKVHTPVAENTTNRNSTKKYTVTDLNKLVLSIIEENFPLGIWVEAEIRDFKRHSSGHWYFSLTDNESQVSAVMWKGVNKGTGFIPRDGDKLLMLGKPTMYTRRGSYQFNVVKMLPAGEGSRALALRRLKEKLQKEGLFDRQYKKPLPRFPQNIGVVTSSTGAAFRDIVNVLSRRAPHVSIILRPATVQGPEAPAAIVRGIEDMNSYGKVDLMIVGRGGGSEDDLWCFNDENVARTIFRSTIPVISAVGHEIDNPVSDLVADLRAPTPSAAAELAVADRDELLFAISDTKRRADNAILKVYTNQIDRLKNARADRIPELLMKRVNDYYQTLDISVSRMKNAATNMLTVRNMELNSLHIRMENSNPMAILSKGYSIVYNEKGTIIRNVEQVNKDEQIAIQLHEGKIKAKVE